LKNLGNRASQPHFTLADLRSTAVLLQLILMDFFLLIFVLCSREWRRNTPPCPDLQL